MEDRGKITPKTMFEALESQWVGGGRVIAQFFSAC